MAQVCGYNAACGFALMRGRELKYVPAIRNCTGSTFALMRGRELK